ncbi:MAG: gamma-glutamyl-gamma-aminobutyrate hydrolase family protein [Chloroflexi bacterium AL-W]|nr:gamma-glutamyl-gamma-aminobutyrate hydrolase family protein [Chloroflexi bacterium AL-N1]NOK66836.1 gamma-glutamyl-gamma-aminobutyrate hydrolase family protein [Chloroflexi bacterium AL-N10]NOK74872.1 gamma-glutamyl-gamma-aminobutyrate hydrolase family protein [Chloroflexi bacterium AL-N5]NOK81439.1 gamma-glutamyl-gamma-aminobutyrate hydrolase family protein [Chloroflexi bacterium AL-W]NOK88908.1 gamma-glutamyl-gamma-aminobutyrate hydrolase family protein [Chloroflexi bacterium AL-N15]
MKPCIGITCGTFRDKDWCPPSYGHRQTYVDAVVAAGGAPMLLPLTDDEEALRVIYDRIDGLLLSGGGDVEPHHYGEQPIPEMGTIDPLRDKVELLMSRWAMEDGKPVLAICRGIQVLNVALGGSLYQDIDAQLETDIPHNNSHKVEDWTHMVHDLRLAPDSHLAHMLGKDPFPINSLHHQSIKDVAPGLRATGWSPDGVVEAIEGTNGQFVVGVQCHPEALQGEADPRWQNLFNQFVRRCY